MAHVASYFRLPQQNKGTGNAGAKILSRMVGHILHHGHVQEGKGNTVGSCPGS